MAPKLIDPALREFGIGLMSSGVSREVAARAASVSPRTAGRWWKAAAVNVPLRKGRVGGVGVSVPPPRDRSSRFLSAEERAVVQAGLSQRLTLAQIGASIGRDKSVISREVARNQGADGVYRAPVADRSAAQRRARPKLFKLAANPGLRSRVEGWMDQGWSPGLIAQVLASDAGGNQAERVSHETIYQALYVQSRGLLRQDLAHQLSTGRTARKPRGGGAQRRGGLFAEALTISQRPPSVADRAVPGHWEGDLIVGASGRSAIGTLVERTTRFVILLHLPGGRHTADVVAAAMIQQMSKLPWHLRRSITWDRGSELAGYLDIQLQLQAPVYFADPASPWQRGSNENTNRLLRFWFKKGTDLSTWTADEIRTVQDTLNQRPRPTLGLRTPATALRHLLTDAA